VEGDTHVTDTEIVQLLNVYYPWFWDILVECAPPDYFVKTVTFSSVAGQLEYALSTVCPDGDFYKIRAIYNQNSDGTLRPLRPIPHAGVMPYKPATSAATISLSYIPGATILAATAVAPEISAFDGINGWEELLVQRTAAAVKRKREEDESPYLRMCAEIENRMRKNSTRDEGEPERVVRRRYQNFPYFWDSNAVTGYRISGNYIQLYSYSPTYWFY
jgi:hypothetical protein